MAISASCRSAQARAKRPMFLMIYSTMNPSSTSTNITPTRFERSCLRVVRLAWSAVRAAPAQSQRSKIPYIREARHLSGAEGSSRRKDQHRSHPRQLGRVAAYGGIDERAHRRALGDSEEALRIQEAQRTGASPA